MASTESVPSNREELEYRFKRVAKQTLKKGKDLTTDALITELIPELVAAVPTAAFDPLQPFDEGILFYHGQVDEAEVTEFQHDLMRAHLNLDPKIPITLNLSSVGGSVFAGLALISTIYDIQRAGRKVNVHIQGVAMSMGSVIAQVANWRTMEPSAIVMAHEVQYAMRGSTADHEEEREFSSKLQDALYQHYSARTGKPIQFYRDKLKKRNWYMSAQEALEEGLVDEIRKAPLYAPPVVAPKATVKRTRKAISA